MQTVSSMAEQLESTALAVWVGESDIVYPLLLSTHVVGLATFAGLILIVDMRLFGLLRVIPFAGLRGPIRLAWFGLFINVISGVALFSSQATVFIENIPFLVKISMIVLAAVSAGAMHKMLRTDAGAWVSAGRATFAARVTAATSLISLVSAIVAGRLIAYF
jgi:hypothetical protein